MNILKLTGAIIYFISGMMGSVVGYYMVDTLIDVVSISTTLEGIVWIALILVWILAIIVYPVHLVLQAIKSE